jgi:hypothetical protein
MANVISHFYGMTIFMSDDSNDREPHFEVLYKGIISKFSLSSCKIYSGDLIPAGQEIIRDWYYINKSRLDENWKLLIEKKPLKLIPAIE